MSSAYLIQLEQKVTSLISEGKYKQAYDLCKSILDKFPDEKSFINLKEKIELLVEEKNSKIVDEKLQQADQLFNGKKYADSIRLIKEILKLSPHNSKALKIEKKAQKEYQEEIAKLRAEFKNKQHVRLTEMLKTNPSELPDELFNLETNNPKDSEIFALTKEFRNKLVEQKIQEKRELLSSNKYDVIESFIEQLRKIDQKNPLIAKLVQIVTARKQEEQINSTKEFVYKGEKYLDTMMKLHKFDKVMQAAEEILTIEKDNNAVKKIYTKAKQKFFLQSRNLTTKAILENLPILESEYKENKENYAKL